MAGMIVGATYSSNGTWFGGRHEASWQCTSEQGFGMRVCKLQTVARGSLGQAWRSTSSSTLLADDWRLNSGGGGNPSLNSLSAASPARSRPEPKYDKFDRGDVEGVVRMLCKEGRLDEAVSLLESMDERGISVNPRVFSSILKLCIRMKALEKGKRVHGYIIKSGLECEIVLSNMLVNMYAKFGSIGTARAVFDNMPSRDVISWTALISGCVAHGYIKDAFKLFKEMQDAGVKPSRVTFISMLHACGSLGVLEEGKRMHALVMESHLELADYVANSLVTMYAKCGSMKEAQKVFNRMPQRDLVSWNAMIAGYAKNGRGWQALNLFKRMQREGESPDAYTFVSALSACASLGALQEGKEIHAASCKAGWHIKPEVGNSLIDMYAKCGSIADARQVFNTMRKHDVVTWNSMIKGYALHGLHQEAFAIFQQMADENVKPDGLTFVSILNACSAATTVKEGRVVHSYLYKTGFEADAFVWNALIDMYAKCGSMEEARDVFEKMGRRDVVSWNTLMAGYAQNGQPRTSLTLFHRMLKEGVLPSAITFTCVLHACASLSTLEEGKEIHDLLIKSGFDNDMTVRNALVHMYVRCGSLDNAGSVLHNGREFPPSCLDAKFWVKKGYHVPS